MKITKNVFLLVMAMKEKSNELEQEGGALCCRV